MNFFIVLCTIFIGLCHCIDPWEINIEADGVMKPKYNKFESETKNSNSECISSDCHTEKEILSDILYKKLLLLIISKSEYVEKNGYYDINTCFQFQEDKYKMIATYIQSKDILTNTEMRTIDGIITNSICKSSKIVEIFQSVWSYLFFIVRNNLNIILIGISLLVSCFVIYKSDWSKVPLKHLFIGLFFTLIYIWEVKDNMEEAEHKYMNDIVEKCSFYTLFFTQSKVDESCLRLYLNNMPKLIRLANPIHVIPRIFTKLIINNLNLFTSMMDGWIVGICSKLNSFVYTPVYVTLNIIFYLFIIFLTIGLISSVLFDHSLSINFLFFNFSIKNGMNSLYNRFRSPSSTIQPATVAIHDSLANNNVTNLIDIVKHLVKEKIPNQPQEMLKIKEDIKVPRASISKIKRKDKFRRVSSVPDNLFKLGAGGDSIHYRGFGKM